MRYLRMIKEAVIRHDQKSVQSAFIGATPITSENVSELAVINSTFPSVYSIFNISEESQDMSTKHNIPLNGLLFKDTIENLILLLYKTSVESVVSRSSLHYPNNTKLSNITENSSNSTTNYSQFSFTKRIKDQVRLVNSKINNLIAFLTENSNIQRFKRSTVANSNSSTTYGVFTQPNSRSKVTKLEDEINKMKDDIRQLKNSSFFSNDDKNEITTLEDRAKNLENLLDNQRREFSEKIEIFEGSIENVSNLVSGLNNEFESIKIKITDLERQQKQNAFIENIQSHNFIAAEEYLKLINDDNKIHRIINKVYNYQEANYDLVLEFGRSFSSAPENRKIVFEIFEALSFEMNSNGNNDSFKIKKLIQSLEVKLIEQDNTPTELKKKSYCLIGKLLARLSKGNINPLLYKAVSNLEIAKHFTEAMEENGINIGSIKDNDHDSFLHKATIKNSMDVVKYLLNEKHVDINNTNYIGSISLHYAALAAHLNLIKYFIDEKNVNVNVQNFIGYTPLHYAALGGHLNVVKYFIEEKHANFNIKSDINFTPLHAAYSGHSDIVRYLLSKNPENVNAHNEVGFTPLHFAALCGLVDAAKYLINEKHVNANIQDKRGSTPLRYASQAGRLDIVKYLVGEGLVNINGRAGCTYLRAAYVHTDVVEYLELRGATC